MSNFNEIQFEKKLHSLKDSQDSIQSLSAWCLQHRQHHKKIVSTWLRVLKKVKTDHRLTLFYLANDVIQYSKRKNYEFVESWGTALQRATTMVREEKVMHRILRIFKIWDERGVYDEAFIADLCGLLTTTTKKPATESSNEGVEFHTSSLVTKIRTCKELEDDTDLKFKRVKESHLTVSDPDIFRSNLKDRRQGDDMMAEVEEGANKLQAYATALEAEIKDRMDLIEFLEIGQNFYETQKGEAKVVANAYRNFGTRVKNLKRRLDDIAPTLRDISPIPSPPNVEDAPSPPPDSDDDVAGGQSVADPEENTYMNPYPPAELQPIRTVMQEDPQAIDKCFSSFMGNSLPFDIQGKPIEVINSRTKAEEGFNITDFLKSLLPQRNSSSSIPGLSLDSSDPEPPSPPLEKQLSYSENPELINSSTNEYEYPPIATSPSPLQPPPMPPNLFPLDESSQYKYPRTQDSEDAWNTKLPPKFPTWGDTSTGWEVDGGEKVSEWMPVLPANKVQLHELDTPESPPMYEKEGFSDPVEYDDSVVDPVLLSSAADVDHRTLVSLPLASHTLEEPLPPEEHLEDTDHRMLMHIPSTNHIKKDIDHRPLTHRKKDVDHRNLISLTGSPLRESHTAIIPPPTPPNLAWPRGDQDYRGQVPPIVSQDMATDMQGIVGEEDMDYRLGEPHKHRDETQDNVESVDMEMSDEEIMENMDDIAAGKRDLPASAKDMEIDNTNTVGKPIISFNINSQAKILTSSPLNEVKEDLSRPRSRVYGCQKIPTIGGRIQSPRPRGFMFNPAGITRLPPPSPRNFRPALLLTPPPVPPPQLLTSKETFNSTVRIKPMAELVKTLQDKQDIPDNETPAEDKSATQSDGAVDDKVNKLDNTNKWIADSDSGPEKESIDNGKSVPDQVDGVVENQWTTTPPPPPPPPPPLINNNAVNNGNRPEAQNVVVEVSISQEQSITVQKWTPNNSGNDFTEPWMNDDIPEFGTHEMIRINNFDRGRGRGMRPHFKNFPPPTLSPQRGGFNPRGRAGWGGPRRGGPPPPPPPPPPRFPFRPSHEPFARGHRGFRPFRGNPPRHFGGW